MMMIPFYCKKMEIEINMDVNKNDFSNTKKYIFIFFVTFLILLGVSAQVVNASSIYSNDKTTVYILTGQSNVKANELVIGQPATYPVDYKLSQLIWNSRNIPTISLGISTEFEKSYNINVEGRFGIYGGDGVMDDYDWLDIGNDWSHWSHHEDTSITGLSTLDFSVDYHLFGKNKKKSANKWSLVFGYRDESWAWESRGGSYIYSSSGILRDDIGNFTPGLAVINYEQSFEMPYLGLKYETRSSKWRFNVQYNYSNQVSVSAIDHHILRNLIFKDDFEKGVMSSYKVGIGYSFMKNFDISLRYDSYTYDEVRGNTTYIDSTTGIPFAYCLNCAGADNSNQSFAIGLSYIY